MAINTEKLRHILQNFVSTTPDVRGAAMVTTDGLPLASSLPGGMDEERVSAMSAAMLSLGERIGRELGTGGMDRVYVQGHDGFSILTTCGDEALFLILANKEAKEGVLILEMKRTLSELKPALM
ncbi:MULTISPECIES: roadblock/LC7 domain-containing protein [unclassified Coleofasciculus]|uniref:roadblock/LC7 domain-containing protein n=1 Tax=unclassified Coleofasciculus TaxID=2692782 RepID=UPI001881CE2B|nr:MULTISPECIES: roadblock/LC7 domain-containing protein [unclassified Coleofasciculus]MBE9128276.1 roadblock/LC7 domain-containing protein [Coleofasciculus sp. LEGE 07081]MBE9151323.1 roadblock/LC7 domain-containing protein [Coleofasciculus sp. LEGE 07092]